MPQAAPGGLLSSNELLGISKLILILLELLLLLCFLASSGSTGDSPELLANKFSISVNEMTPINLPINFEPRVGIGVNGDASGGIAIAWAMVGVGGADDAGLGDSTSHILDKCLAVTIPGLLF